MRRAIGMALLRPQHVPCWTIDRHRIGPWLDRMEPEAPVAIGCEFAAQVHIGLRRVLVFIKARRSRLPDIHFDARKRRAARVGDTAACKKLRSWRGDRTIDPPFSVRGDFMRQKGPSNAEAVSVAPLLPLLRRQTRVDSPIASENKHRLVMGIVSCLADAIDEIYAILPLSFREIGFAREGVKMAHKRTHNFENALIAALRHRLQHSVGDVFLPLDDHDCPLQLIWFVQTIAS